MIPSTLANYYKLHAPFYDATRWSFLFGRNSIEDILPNLDRCSSILDIGCGTCKVTSKLSNSFPNCSITGIDSSYHMLKKARLKKLQNVQWIEEEFGQHSFPQQTFDLIVASYSLTMVSQIDEVISSIKTTMKSDGTLIVVDFDNTPYQWFEDWMKANHVHFNYQIFDRLEAEFNVHAKVTKRAYAGLYSYSTIICKV